MFISGIFILYAYWSMAGVIVWIEMIKSLRYYIKSLRLYNICIKKCHTDEIQNIIIKTFGIERTVKGDFESPFPRLSACSRINELLSYIYTKVLHIVRMCKNMWSNYATQ